MERAQSQIRGSRRRYDGSSGETAESASSKKCYQANPFPYSHGYPDDRAFGRCTRRLR